MQTKTKRAASSPDTSPYVHKKKEKFSLDLKIRDLPWTEKQKQFIEIAMDKKTRIMIVSGPAGSSKSLLAVYCALQKINQKTTSEIIYTRVPVEACDYGIGYIKGDQAAKMSPYIEPCIDKLRELLMAQQITALLNDQRIVGTPLGFMRGLNLTGTVIFDECQNGTLQNFLLVLSRMANFSNLFVLGDMSQQDTKKSGFKKVFDAFNNDKAKDHGIHTFEFGKEDIMRSKSLSYIIETFEEINKPPADPGAWRPSVKV
jgi:phosphate starvation-inducible protein PhoH